MKRILFISLILLFGTTIFAQPTFDLGIKAGINNSKLSLNKSDYNSESIVKAHIGAFGRIGWSRLYLQPEIYFSAKGGDISSNPSNPIKTATAFNYNNVDVPMLLGFKVIKGKVVDVHVIAGPVFSFITKSEIDNETLFDPDYYKNHYVGVQYGLGADILFFTIDARMEHGNTLYDHPALEGKNSTFMITVGFKIL
ncbi:MAG: porin family protein [Bacteroidota bacterium]